jgi:hypothetical protein
MYKRILVPLDGSELSEEVLPLVRSLIETNKTEIILLRVVEYPYTLYYGCDEYPPFDPEQAKIVQDMKRAIYQEVRGYLEQVASPLRMAKRNKFAKARSSNLSRRSFKRDLMSACGQSAVLGAIADRLLREARVPVTTCFLFCHTRSFPRKSLV